MPLTELFCLSNTGLFHLIYKTVNDCILCKANQNEPHRFFCDYEIFTSKLVVNRI